MSLVWLAAPVRADDTAVPKGVTPSDWSSIRAAYEAGRHAAYADDATPGQFVSRNPGQQWRTRFDGRGFLTTPNAGGWSWGLDLVSYGRGDAQQTISGTAPIQPNGTRVEYAWSDALTEWYVNDQGGLEHGYTLRERPEGASGSDGMLHFTLAVRGDLHPRVSGNGRDVAFNTTTDGGTTALTYNDLRVFDADGVHLAASFQVVTSDSCTSSLLLTIDDTHARYPLTIDPTAQQAYLKASNTGQNDLFGRSVAISGDTVVVGAWLEDSNATGVNAPVSGGSGTQADNSAPDSGAAYVFVRSGTTWTQQAYLKASNTGAGDNFSWSLAISGDTIVVGSFSEDSNATDVDGNQGDNSATDSGAAYVFVRSGTTWTQQAYLKASNTGASDWFGHYVAVWGDTVVVGAWREASNATGINGDQVNNSASGSGAAYVFVRSGTTWTQQAYLKASNTGSGDTFSGSVGISGDTIVIGAREEGSNATGVNAPASGGSGTQADNSAASSGAAYVFVLSGTTWTQQAYLKASNTGRGDIFGHSVAISGDTVVVGARNEASNATGANGNQANNSAGGAGAAYVFARSGTTWTQQAYLKASNTGASDGFGSSVAVSGDTVVVGAPAEASNATGVNAPVSGGSGTQADNSALSSGAAYVFVRSGTAWTQQAYLKASNTGRVSGVSVALGWSVAVSGDTVVVGAIWEDSNASGVNGNQTDNSALNSGSAYIFVLGLPAPTSPLATPATVCSGNPAALSVTDPGPGIVIDWYTDSCGGTLIGTGNPFNVTPAATTTYFARARRTSDGNTSDACVPATITVPGLDDPTCCPCPADFDGSGGTPDSTDIGAFFTAWLLGDPTADTDCSGGTPDTQDIDTFFVTWLAGGC